MLDTIYNATLSKTPNEIQSSGGGTLSIGRATDNLAKSRSNVILRTPLPLFIEHVKSYQNQETIPNAARKLDHTMKRLNENLGIKCTSIFISDSCNGRRNDPSKFTGKKFIKGQYGGAAHFLRNFTDDIEKLPF